jgi:hypothetical protein
LTSAAFAKICPRPLVWLGFHPVRGLLSAGEQTRSANLP